MKLNIAILGTRGIPNNYGGFEYVAAELSAGLVRKGHSVTVYSSRRHPYRLKEWNGVGIIHCSDPEKLLGNAGQFIYDLNCIRNARKKKFDIILMLGYTSSSVWGFLYPKDTAVITNMDGLEWKRSKYSAPAKKFLRYAEKIAVKPGRFYVADSPSIKTYLDGKYSINSRYIAYGTSFTENITEELITAYNIKKAGYFMLMARFEPENNIETVLDGYVLSGFATPFVVVGNTTNRFGKYIRHKYSNNSNIIFTGAVFEPRKVQSLTACCKLYFHGHSVGGTNPSLLAAMSLKAPIAAHSNDFNRSVLGENASFFTTAADVCAVITHENYPGETQVQNNYETVKNEFNWDLITNQYEQYFIECYNKTHGTT